MLNVIHQENKKVNKQHVAGVVHHLLDQEVIVAMS